MHISSSAANCGHKCLTNVRLRQVLDIHVVLDSPLISFKEDHVRKGHEMTSKHFDEIGDPGYGHASWTIDRLQILISGP